MANFDMLQGIIQLSNLSEQRKARKQQKEFQETYEGPLKEAYTSYYNAMVDKMQDEELLGYEKALKRAQVSGAEAEVGITQATFDEIKKLRAGSDEDRSIARNYLLKINQNDAFRDQLAAIRVRNEQLQTMISAQNQAITMQKFEQEKTESIIGLFLSPEGKKFMEEILGKQGAAETKTRAAEKFAGQKAPVKKKPSGRSTLGKAISGAKAIAPFMSPALGAAKIIKSAIKPKAPEKKPAVMNEISFDRDLAPVFDIADANDVDRSSIYEGVQRLVERFPELTKDDILDAYKLLAEGVTVEELIKHYESKKGKNE